MGNPHLLSGLSALPLTPFAQGRPDAGVFGGYLTGSNTGAAAMYSGATTTAAAHLGADPLIAVAGQNVAGSFAIIASPPRIALAVGVALGAGEQLPGSAAPCAPCWPWSRRSSGSWGPRPGAGMTDAGDARPACLSEQLRPQDLSDDPGGIRES